MKILPIKNQMGIKKEVRFYLNQTSLCGETGIRTPGTSQFNGFQDRRNRPLCHLSKVLYSKVSWESLFPFRLRVQR